MLTIAKIEYATGKYGYCHVNFEGQDAYYFTSKWCDINNEKYRACQRDIEALEAKKKLYQTNLEETEVKLKHSKKWYRPWYTADEKKLLETRRWVLDKIYTFNDRIAKLEDERWESPYAIHNKAVNFLIKNGFNMIADTVNRYDVHTETWSR